MDGRCPLTSSILLWMIPNSTFVSRVRFSISIIQRTSSISANQSFVPYWFILRRSRESRRCSQCRGIALRYLLLEIVTMGWRVAFLARWRRRWGRPIGFASIDGRFFMRTRIEDSTLDEGLVAFIRWFVERSDEFFQDFFPFIGFDLCTHIVAFSSRETGTCVRRSCTLVEGSQFAFT